MKPTIITPETAKKIKRLMWVHVLLTVLSLAVLGYVSWRLWQVATTAPLTLIYLAALLVIVKELLSLYSKFYTHWRKLYAEARAAWFVGLWWWLK